MVCFICNTDYKLSSKELQLYQKFGFKPLNECFECNQKKRLAFRNERTLYARKCNLTGEAIISIYSPDKPYKVYSLSAWYGDQWNPLDYGREFDFSRPFFDQFNELVLATPRMALVNMNSENSDYCNMTLFNKNCFLVFGGDFNQDVIYGTLCMHNQDCMDLDFSHQNQLSYMLGDTVNSYGCQFVFDSKNCKNSFFLSDCINCTDCILSVNLVNKKYCIENKQYTQEEYEKKKKELLNDSYSAQQEMIEKFKKMRKNRVVKYAQIVGSEECSGDHIKDSKNCKNCFDVSDSEDLCNVIFSNNAKDALNASLLGDNAELIYESFGVAGGTNVKFSNFIIHSSDIEYSDTLFNCRDSFACTNLQQKQYCILNKQYARKDYFELREKIIEHMKSTGEWGQYFPKHLSCFGYNETSANNYFPLNQEQALAQGFKWSHAEQKAPEAEKIIPANQLPDCTSSIPNDVLNWAIKCEVSEKLFKINKKELEFYRKNSLPLPRLHPEERHKLRQSFRNPRRFYESECDNCGTKIQTTFPEGHSEKVYCEDCYLKEVY